MKNRKHFVQFSIMVLLSVVFSMLTTQAQAGEIYRWKMSTWASKGTLYGDYIFPNFCENVKEMSGGRLIISVTGSGEVIGEAETFDAVRTGLLEVAVPYPGYYSGTVPQSLIETGLPFSLTNALEIDTLFRKRGFAEVLRKEVYAPLGCYYLGPSIQPGTPLISKTPIKSLSDIKGKKIRAGGPQAKVLAKLGAKIVIVPYGEVYTALATGVVDGAVCGSSGETYDLKLYEMAKYYMRPDVVPAQICPMLVNMKAWKSLPPDLQRILLIAARENNQLMEIECWNQNDMAWEEMRKSGVQSHVLSDTDQSKLREVGKELWDELGRQDAVSGKLVKILEDYMVFLGYLK